MLPPCLDIVDINLSDVLHLLEAQAVQNIPTPKVKQNIFEGMLLVRCDIVTVKNRKSSL